MFYRQITLAASLALVCAASTGAMAAAKTPGPAVIEPGSPLLERLVDLERAPGSLCRPPDGDAETATLIEALATRLRSQIEPGNGLGAVQAVNRLVFEELGIQPSRDLRDPRNLCLASVLSRREGYCVGIASLYVVLAEEVGLPIHAVATPGHVFLRYDDGRTRINIETFQRGAAVSDAEYIEREKIPAQSVARGVFLRTLSRDGLLAQIHNNLGVIHSEQGDVDRATQEYERAIDLDRNLAAAYYNWGSDLLRVDASQRAVRLLTQALDLWPTDVWALNNRGVAYRNLGKVKKARRDFEAALMIAPDFGRAQENLATLPAQ